MIVDSLNYDDYV